jgi:hypothetical protein
MPRPKKEPGQRRDFNYTVHLNADEYKQIENKANRMKLPVSVFLREASIGSVLIEPDPNLVKLLSEFSKIGANLNQLTKKVNVTGINLSEDQITALKTIYARLKEVQKAVLK